MNSSRPSHASIDDGRTDGAQPGISRPSSLSSHQEAYVMPRMALNMFLGTCLMFLGMSAHQAAASPLKSYALDSSKVALGVPGKLASGPGLHWESAVASGVGMEAGQFGSRPTEAVSSNAAAGTSPRLPQSDLTPPQSGGVDAS